MRTPHYQRPPSNMGNSGSLSSSLDENHALATDQQNRPILPSQEPLEPRLSPIGVFRQHIRTEETLLKIRGKRIMIFTHAAANEPSSEIFRFRESPISLSRRASEYNKAA